MKQPDDWTKSLRDGASKGVEAFYEYVLDPLWRGLGHVKEAYRLGALTVWEELNYLLEGLPDGVRTSILFAAAFLATLLLIDIFQGTL